MKPILVGIEGSPRATDVLNRAIHMAKLHQTQLTIIRVVSVPVEFPMEAISVAPDALPAQWMNVAQRGLERFTENVPRDLIERVEARLGTPWQVLCEAAKELDAQMVVIGTHGYTMLDRLLGTTAARVVNHAPCSVLVVRAEEPESDAAAE